MPASLLGILLALIIAIVCVDAWQSPTGTGAGLLAWAVVLILLGGCVALLEAIARDAWAWACGRGRARAGRLGRARRPGR